MVQGLLVDVKSDELLSIFKERLVHHQEKSKTYAEQANALAAQLKNIEEDLMTGKVSGGGTPIDTLNKKAREHQDNAHWYDFMIKHVIQNDVYRLDQRDLQRIGITVGNNFY